MISALIAVIITLFAFIGVEAPDSALPALQNAHDKVVAALSEVDPPNENSSSNSAGENGQNDVGDAVIVDENGDPAEPDITKVFAYNIKAEFALPTEIPQTAVDYSVALIGCGEEGADCETISPTDNGSGNSDKSKNNNTNNANGNSASHKKI